MSLSENCSKGLRRSAASGLYPGVSPSGRLRSWGISRRTRWPSQRHCAAALSRFIASSSAGWFGARRPSQYSSNRRSKISHASRGSVKAMRRVRCTSARSNRSMSASAAVASISSERPTRKPRARSAPAKRASCATRPCAPLMASLSGRGVRQQLAEFLLARRLDVVLVLEEAAERRPHGLGVERVAVQAHQRLRPVERLRHARELTQRLPAQLLHEARERRGELL